MRNKAYQCPDCKARLLDVIPENSAYCAICGWAGYVKEDDEMPFRRCRAKHCFFEAEKGSMLCEKHRMRLRL